LYRVDDPWQVSTLLSKQRHLARAVSVVEWACLVDAWGVASYILWVLFRNTRLLPALRLGSALLSYGAVMA
jgi:hypothetical protein